jgi:hypothetical protein
MCMLLVVVVTSSVFDVAVLVDALGSGVNHCASMTGAALCVCLTWFVHVVSSSMLDAVLLYNALVFSVNGVCGCASPTAAAFCAQFT